MRGRNQLIFMLTRSLVDNFRNVFPGIDIDNISEGKILSELTWDEDVVS